MLFPTIDFAIFFVIVLTASWLLMQQPGWWRAFMLVASYVFYGWWDWRFCFLLAGSTIVNHAAATALARMHGQRGRRIVLTLALAANLGVLGWFKYYGFLVSSVANALRAIGLPADLPLLQIVLPVGISFFTFQAISYVMDVYRGDLRAYPLVDFAVYLSFFPQLVAGPIVRGGELIPQLRRRQDPRTVDATRAFWLITGGLFKKVVVANLLATELVDRVFANPGLYAGHEVLLAVYGYAVQIYADFSGYTDIAIGVALLLGFSFPQNFNRPYTALSVQDFWRRWHMTLSRWLRDYLYIPLGGSAGSPRRTRANLLATMLLGGLWHGAAWTFVLWGGLHGAWMAGERALRGRRTWGRMPGDRVGEPVPQPAAVGVAAEPSTAALPDEPDRVPAEATAVGVRSRVLRWAVTFHVVCLAWIFFRAESLGAAFDVLGRLLTGWGAPSGLEPSVPVTVLFLVVVGAIAAQFVPPGVGLRVQGAFSRASLVAQAGTLALALFVIDALGPDGVAPFIYFQF